MSALIDDLTQSLTTLLASGSGILASTLRTFQAKVIAAIAVLEARARGNRIFYTNGVPPDALGMEGDLGVNKDNGDFFEFTGGTFVFLFNAKPQAGTGGGGAAYTLPAATSTALGGVKVGSRLSMGNDGTLNVPVASDTVAGVVRVDNDTLTVKNGVLALTTSAGNISVSATPTNVTAVIDPDRNGNRAVCRIGWDAMPGATLYQVYYSENGGPFVQLGIVPYPYLYDTSGRSQGGYLRYHVTSANSVGQSPASADAVAQ